MRPRDPGPALRPYVRTLWATPPPRFAPSGAASRGRVLPTGAVHLVFRSSDEPLRLYEDLANATGSAVDRAIVGGTRSRFYVRSLAEPTGSIGVLLRAGAAECLLGVPAGGLAGRQVSLFDLWGPAAERMCAQVFEAVSPERQLDLLETILTARISRIRALHPAVTGALARFRTAPDVRAAVRDSDYSHRRFVELFRRSVGLSPKRFCRIRRFQVALARLAAAPAAGYSERSHLHREFREFAGVTPGEYRRVAPRFPIHVPLARSAGAQT